MGASHTYRYIKVPAKPTDILTFDICSGSSTSTHQRTLYTVTDNVRTTVFSKTGDYNSAEADGQFVHYYGKADGTYSYMTITALVDVYWTSGMNASTPFNFAAAGTVFANKQKVPNASGRTYFIYPA